MSDTFSHILTGIENQTFAWLCVGFVTGCLFCAFVVVGWMLNSAASCIYRTDDRPIPPLVDHPRVTSLRGPAAKGFQHHQQMSASILAFRRVH